MDNTDKIKSLIDKVYDRILSNPTIYKNHCLFEHYILSINGITLHYKKRCNIFNIDNQSISTTHILGAMNSNIKESTLYSYAILQILDMYELTDDEYTNTIVNKFLFIKKVSFENTVLLFKETMDILSSSLDEEYDYALFVNTILYNRQNIYDNFDMFISLFNKFKIGSYYYFTLYHFPTIVISSLLDNIHWKRDDNTIEAIEAHNISMFEDTLAERIYHQMIIVNNINLIEETLKDE